MLCLPNMSIGEESAEPHNQATTQISFDELPDEAWIHIISFCTLDLIGRLACTAKRFTEPTVKNPDGGFI